MGLRGSMYFQVWGLVVGAAGWAVKIQKKKVCCKRKVIAPTDQWLFREYATFII